MIQNTGTDNMMAPEALALMGITNEGRDIPVRQLAADGRDGRYVVSLVNIRKIHEFVFHRRQGDVLILHLSDTRLPGCRACAIRATASLRSSPTPPTPKTTSSNKSPFGSDRIPGALVL